MTNHAPLPQQVVELSAALSQPRPMRRGSVNERRMKCGQANCACQRDPKARHGPYYTLTQAAGGKTRSRYVVAEQVPVLRRQIEAGREFRQQEEAYWGACEQWADAELEQTQAAEAAEKRALGGSPGSDRRRTGGALRPVSGSGSGPGSGRDGGTPPSVAAGCPSLRAAPERGCERLRRSAVGVCLRTVGAVCRSARQELRERARPTAVGAGLLSLRGLRARLLPP